MSASRAIFAITVKGGIPKPRNDRTRLTTFNYESVAMIKSSLQANKETSTSKEVSEAMKINITKAYNTYMKHLHGKVEKDDNASYVSESKKKDSMKTPQKQTSSKENPKVTEIVVSQKPSPASEANLTEVSSKGILTVNKTQAKKRMSQAPLVGFFTKKPRTS